MATIKLKGKKVTYNEVKLDINTLPPITKEDAKETLCVTRDLLKTKGLDLFLTYGTLLGAVREKNFIDGDLDVDAYVTDEQKLFDILPYLEDNGLHLIRVVKHIVYSFRYENREGCYIDLYIVHVPFNIWGCYCYQHSASMIPRKYLQEGEIEFMGSTFKCPKNPESVLRHWYGETWDIPIGKSEKQYRYTVTSHYYYLKAKQKIKDVIKFCIGWKYWKHRVKKG